MKKTLCDACSAPIGPVGFEVKWVGWADPESGDGVRVAGDYCSTQCIMRALNTAGVKRPDFNTARGSVAGVAHR